VVGIFTSTICTAANFSSAERAVRPGRGALLIEWTAMLADLMKPPEIFGGGVLDYGWNPFFAPQLTLPSAPLRRLAR
jgi:hypothetical protein